MFKITCKPHRDNQDGVEPHGGLGVDERLVGPEETLQEVGRHLYVGYSAQLPPRQVGVQNHYIDLFIHEAERPCDGKGERLSKNFQSGLREGRFGTGSREEDSLEGGG